MLTMLLLLLSGVLLLMGASSSSGMRGGWPKLLAVIIGLADIVQAILILA